MLIESSVEDRIALVKINRPQAMNALNREVIGALSGTISSLKNIAVLILTGEGKAFVAGADIAAMKTMSAKEAMQFSELGQNLMSLISDSTFVTIAAVNGFALGGGLELAMACDLIYASDKAKLALPETNLGLVPGFGGTSNLVHRIGFHRALEMVLRGQMISAEEAKARGLVLEIFPDAELLTQTRAIALALAKKGPKSMAAAKRLVRANAMPRRRDEFALERESFGALFSGAEPQEGISAFLEKREAKFV